MKKLKLIPSARDNRRYFLVNSTDREKIERVILDYVGILGFAKSAFIFVENDEKKIICSCLRGELENVRASLAFAKIKIQKVSGTISGLKR